MGEEKSKRNFGKAAKKEERALRNMEKWTRRSMDGRGAIRTVRWLGLKTDPFFPDKNGKTVFTFCMSGSRLVIEIGSAVTT